jgi:hypothetical protein
MGERDRDRVGRPAAPEETAFSNSIRLTGRQWVGVGLFAALFVAVAPWLWTRVEPVAVDADYRMPHELSNDYWLYERCAGIAAGRCDTVLLGDSVIWGEYVTRHETLSHYLNEQAGGESCANLGLNGAHPLALTGLVENYAGCVTGKNVVLHCNPLWLSAPQPDLQEAGASGFNHPRLIPQFVPHVPAYKEEVSPRLGVAVERHLPFSNWSNHLQQAYYDQTGIPSWTLEHPYDNPLRPLTRGLPPADESRRHLSLPWYKNTTPQDFPWVDLDTSLQWYGFRRVVDDLRRRGNRVFVLVGPFNEHMLTPASRQRYQKVKDGIASWLQAQHIDHVVPPPLPSEEYGDASHPLATGYVRLARQLLEDPAFPRPARPRDLTAGSSRPGR